MGDEGAIGAWGSFCPRKTVTSYPDTRDTQPPSVKERALRTLSKTQDKKNLDWKPIGGQPGDVKFGLTTSSAAAINVGQCLILCRNQIVSDKYKRFEDFHSDSDSSL